MNGSIFLNYRRNDTAGYAGRLAVDLRAGLEGDRRIIMDVDTFGPGDLFAESIDRALYECDAFITLIGRRWLDTDSTGLRRIDDPQDWVRIELAIALSRKIRVIPVLVDGAVLPEKAELPTELSGLRDHHALVLDNSTWQVGLDRLVRSIATTGAANYPILKLSANEVDFGTVGLNEPSPRQSVRLINTGMGQLNPSAASDLPWLIVSTREDALDLMIDTSEPGHHAGQVVVRSAGGKATIDVSATVSAQRRSRPPAPRESAPRRPTERVRAIAKWLTAGLLLCALVTQFAWSSSMRSAILASRPNLPPDGPWATLAWLLPAPLLIIAACLVVMGRRAGIALGCIGSAALWLITSLVLVRSTPESFDTSSHDVTLILLMAAVCGLVIAAPETRERVRPNRVHRVVVALVLLGCAIFLRVQSGQIAQAVTGATPEDGSIDWVRHLDAPAIWLSVLVPIIICVPAAVVVCNREQRQALVTLAFLQILYPVVVRAMTFRGSVDHGQDASAVLVADLVFVAGSVCILLAVRLGQRTSVDG